MSDNSDYYSESDSESEISETELKNKGSKKPIIIKPLNNIQSYEDESEEELDTELDDQLPDNDEDNDEIDYDSDKEKKVKDNDDEEEVEAEEESVYSEDEDIELDEDGEPIEQKANTKSNKKSAPKKKTQLILDEDEDYEDEDYDENYLQKFDSEITKNYINDFHPECLVNNYDEISKLTIVIRNNDNIIIDPFHKTIPFLTKYEKARILGQRAKQVESGAKPFINVPENIVDSYIIAELELQQKKIPFIIRRPIPGGACEYWNLKDLEIISF